MYISTKNIILAAIALLVVIGGLFFFLTREAGLSKASNTATIEGTIDLNGVAPEGSTIAIQTKEQNSGSFQTVIQNLAAQDRVDWVWNQAKAGSNYEVRAQLMQSGKVVSTSATILVTAPATNEDIELNIVAPVSPSPTPAASAATPTPTPAPQVSRITGVIDLNGYVPAGSYITLQQRVSGQTQYNQIGTSFSASDGETWVWKEPVAGTTYNLQAVLTNAAGSNIGQSQAITVTAPAANEVLKINSQATPPAPATGNISGSINFNGVAPQNSSIVILQSVTGSNNYSVAVSGIQPVNGSQWVWNQAKAGVSYQLVAVLKQQNSNGTQTDMATSQSLIVSAPASNELFTINSNISLPAPNNGPITVNCGTKNGAQNNWPAVVSFPTVSGAQTYQMQIGTSSGGYDLVNSTMNATNNPAQTVNATFNSSITYYAQYAYSYVPNATWGNGFSTFSTIYQLKCQ